MSGMDTELKEQQSGPWDFPHLIRQWDRYPESHTVMSAWVLPSSPWRKTPLLAARSSTNSLLLLGAFLEQSILTSHARQTDLTLKHVDVTFKLPVAPSPRAWLRESLEAGQGVWDTNRTYKSLNSQKCCSFLIIVILHPALPERMLFK